HRHLHSFPTRRSSDLLEYLSEHLLQLNSLWRVHQRTSRDVHLILDCVALDDQAGPLFTGTSRPNRGRSTFLHIQCEIWYSFNGRSEEHTSELQSRFDL